MPHRLAWVSGAAHVSQVPAFYAVWPLLISIGAKFGLVMIKRRHGQEIGSSSLLADAANDGVDMLSGAVALTALSLTLLDPARFLRADQYGAAAVGLIVIAVSIRVMHEASYHLMDTMPDDQSMKMIREVALSVPDVAGVEKCFARKTGLKLSRRSAPRSGSRHHRSPVSRDRAEGARPCSPATAVGRRRSGSR